MLIEGLGISVELPGGWEGRIFRHEPGYPTLHAATFPLPATDGEFGGRALGAMPAGGAFVAVTEYSRRLAGSALFASAQGVAPLLPAAFSPRTLQRLRPGQVGSQRFLTLAGRPFCVYVVLGVGPGGVTSPGQANTVLAGLRIDGAFATSTSRRDRPAGDERWPAV